MNKKTVVFSIILLVIFALVFVCLLPVNVLKGCKPEDITRIEILEGLSCTEITDENEVRTIAENIYSCGMKKDGFSFGRMGYVYKLKFYSGDKYVSEISLCGSDRARDSIFFYHPENGSYCKEYLDELAEKYSKS